MKHFFYFSMLCLFVSCNKEKQKSKWEIIPVMDKSAELKDYEIMDMFITSAGAAFCMIKEYSNETHIGIYHSSNSGESWTRLIGDESFGGQEFTSFSQSADNLFIMAYASSDLTHTLYRYEMSTGFSTEKQLPELLDNSIADFHPQIDFISETTGFIGYRGIWKTLDTGNVWTREYPFGDVIHALQFTTDNEAFALNQEHCLYTNDQWENWDTLFSSYGADFRKIQMANSKTGIIVGRQLWLTEDGGKNWTVILDETVADASINQSGEVYVISMDYGIARSLNFGESWSKRTDKKGGFTTVFTSENLTLSGLKNDFKDSGQSEKDGVIIGRLKN